MPRDKRRQSPRARQLTASEGARLVVSLARIGSVVVETGWCLGPVSIYELNASGAYPTRADRLRWSLKIRSVALQRWHLFAGHDAGCREFGIPVATLRRLVRGFAGADAGSFLVEAVTETIDQRMDWTEIERERIDSVDHLTLNLERRITPARTLPEIKNGTIIRDDHAVLRQRT